MKKILSFLFVLSLFFQNYIVYADTVNSEIKMPDINISEINMDKREYSQGEILKGSFLISNKANQNSSNLFYSLYIVDYSDEDKSKKKNSYTLVDSLGIESLKSFESKKINFEYSIPKGVGTNKMNLEIRISGTSGSLLSLKSSEYFSIKGGVEQIDILGAGIIILKKDQKIIVQPASGPTFYKDQSPNGADLGFALKNKNTKDVELKISMEVYDTLKDNKVVLKKDLDQFIIKSNTETKKEYTLPNLDYRQSVYLAKISIKDTEGNHRTSDIYYRYIIGGNIVDIKDAQIDKTSLKKNDKYFLEINFTGNPIDFIQNQISFEEGKVPEINEFKNKFRVSVFDANGEIISNDEREFNEFKDLEPIELIASKKTEFIKIKIEAIDSNNNILDTFEKDIYLDKSEVNYNMIYIISVFIFFSIVLIGFFIYLKRKNKLNQNIILPMLAIIMIVSFGAFYVNRGVVSSYVLNFEGFTSENSSIDALNFCEKYMKNLKVLVTNDTHLSSPKMPGQIFNIDFYSEYAQCTNTPVSMGFYVYDTGNSATTTLITGGYDSCNGESYCPEGGHTFISRYGNSAINIKATTTPGNYQLKIKAIEYNGMCQGVVSGTINYTVQNPTPSIPIDGSCSTNNTVNQCDKGNVLNVESSTTTNGVSYTWNCKGLGGGTDASCQKPISNPEIINGSCDNSVINRCISGKLDNIEDNATRYFWNCLGINGGKLDICGMDKPNNIDPECNQSVKYLCKNGSAINKMENQINYTWDCVVGDKEPESCSYPIDLSIEEFKVDPVIIKKNESGNISWKIKGANSCEINGGKFKNLKISTTTSVNSINTGSITETTKYTMLCGGSTYLNKSSSTASTTKQIIIQINPNSSEI